MATKMFHVGEVVELMGLSTILMNGALGTIGGLEPTGRYKVRLSSPAPAVTAYPDNISVRLINLIKISLCAKYGCNKKGIHLCGACKHELYCSTDCQKKDWKIHKKTCSTLKKTTTELLPFNEVFDIISGLEMPHKILMKLDRDGVSNGVVKATDSVLATLNHAISFAEYQFAEPARPGDTYRIRMKGGSRVDEYKIMDWMFHLYYSTARLQDCLIIAELYYESARRSLDACLRLDSIDRLTEGQRKNLYANVCKIEKCLWDTCLSHKFYQFMHEGNLCTDTLGELKQLRKAENHSQQRLIFSKRLSNYEGDSEDSDAMIACGKVQERLGRLCEDDAERDGFEKKATMFYEDAYNNLAEIYGPVHPLVQRAAQSLIINVMSTRDYERAEGFARVNWGKY